MNIDREYLDYAIKQIIDLCSIPSPAGFTKHAEEYLIKEFENLGYKTVHSKKGSVIVDLGGEGNGLVLAAHIDTLGAMVRSVKENGRLRLTKIGFYPENN
ncbi:MAG: peptidase M42, partial [Clostridiaceae bacterium]